MNQKNALVVLSAWLALVLSPVTASRAADVTTSVPAGESGGVEGRVLNLTSGQYLNNARVTVEGTSLETFSDSAGRFRLNGVPAGKPRIRVFYSGFPAQTATVVVTAGATATQDFSFAAGDQGDGKVTVLDKFLVTSTRETDARNIATNEQRFAANIKSVVAADAFGDATGGNVGEILKYLPGVTIDYIASEAQSISLRGFGGEFTSVTADGARMPNGLRTPDRTFELQQVSINNISRVEVTKVPTPSMSADSLGGTVNLVSRSAFESSQTEFKYRTYLSMNSDETNIFKKTPGPTHEPTYKVLPGLDFNYIAPLTENFGIVINGLASSQFNAQNAHRAIWRFNGAGATPEAPFLRQYSTLPGPKNIYRNSLSFQADWRPAKDHVISVGAQWNYYHQNFQSLNHLINTGNGTPLSFGPDFTHGGPGGSIIQEGISYDGYSGMLGANITHRYRGRLWEIDSGINASRAKTYYRDSWEGHFHNAFTTLRGVSRILFDGIQGSTPGKITVLDAAGQPIDSTDLNNYTLTRVDLTNPWDGLDGIKAARLNVKRRLDFLPFEASLKVGGTVQEQHRDLSGSHLNALTFVGADGLPNTADDSAGPYADPKSLNQPDYFGLPALPYVSTYRLWDLFQSHPEYFTQTNAQTVQAARQRMANSFDLTERISAVYIEGETRIFRNRLRILTGVRFEKTESHGVGPLFDPGAAFQRDAGGKFLLTSSGARIRKPEAGAAGSLEELALTSTFRGNTADRTYDGLYPSLHLTYNLTDNLLLRAAYARTIGRPNIRNILPNTTVNENANPEATPGDSPGSINVVNSGLLPYSAENYDLSLEYYFPQGGLVTVGGFRKDLTDFFGSLNTIATAELLSEFGLDQRYLGWDVRTRINVAEAARVTGFEFNYNQPLTFLPGWGRYFNFNASLTQLRLQGPRETDFNRFIPRSGNLVLTYSKKPVVLLVKWQYRGRQRLGRYPAGGADAFQWNAARGLVDVNAEYQFAKHVAVFANVRNLFNKTFVTEVASPVTPGYSAPIHMVDYGAMYSFGIKGSF